MRRSLQTLTLAAAIALATLAPATSAQAADPPAAAPPPQPGPLPPGHITGIGGVFVTSPDPKALAAWYRDVLGLPVEAWGGAVLRQDAPGHPPATAWNAFPAHARYLAPSTREFMLDLAVDDMDAILARLKAHGVAILKQDDTDPTGRFAWILDPDGTKIELWQAR